MWQVDNRTPFAADRAWVRDREGMEVWLVAVKCTFDVGVDGSLTISSAQPPVLRVPEYFGDPGKSSLKYEADLVLTKTTSDVVVVGHAYAPKGRPVEQLDVELRVGPIQKIVRVFGDRVWRNGGVSPPVPFLRMPLVYERAFGGGDRRSPSPDRDWDWRNPVGTGFVIAREHVAGVQVPNIEYPDQLISSWKDRPEPAGLGPICAHWQQRAAFAGTYDNVWMRDRQPLLPVDFDNRFFQCAPQDQQSPTFLRGDEQVVVRGLSRDGELRFTLPKIFLGFETLFYDGSREIHQERRLHCVVLEPDYPRVSLVWHTALPCHFKVQKLAKTIVTLKEPLGGISSDESNEDALE